MDLFEQATGTLRNHLPKEGEAYYYGPIFNIAQSDAYFDQLYTDIPWQNDQFHIHGKEIITKRKIAWFGDQNFKYTYSNMTKTARLWTPLLKELKGYVEEKIGKKYNSCLLNLYHSGEEGMTWHSDAEKDLITYGSIASLTFGAARSFAFKHKKTKESLSLVLEHGALLEMCGTTQESWLHSVPKTTMIHTARINLTFRQIRPNACMAR